jgi:hypothetical protein
MADIRQGVLQRILAPMNLRFPGLFVVFCALMLADFLVPDLIPFVDEIGLTILAALFGMWKKRKEV